MTPGRSLPSLSLVSTRLNGSAEKFTGKGPSLLSEKEPPDQCRGGLPEEVLGPSAAPHALRDKVPHAQASLPWDGWPPSRPLHQTALPHL